MKKTKYFMACAIFLSCAPGFAQSSVQCSIDRDGKLSAALVWQNTLGVERANTLCRSAQDTKSTRQQPTASNMGAGASYQPVYSQAPLPDVRQSNQQAADEDFVPMQ